MASSIIAHQTCTKCNVPKSLSEFNKRSDPSYPNGRRYTCRECDRVYRKVHKVKFALNLANQRHNWMRMHKYGITAAEYNSMLIAQNGLCAICLQPETARCRKDRSQLRRLAVDHCHTTGRIRGLLCSKCNKGLAIFGDSFDGMKRVIDYLSYP